MAPRDAQSKTSSRGAGKAACGAPLYRVEDFVVEESIGYLVKRVRSMLGVAVEHEIADSIDNDVTYEQWGVLVMILMRRGDTAAALARLVDCDTGSMTRMLDRLEAKELIVRTRSTDDRRQVRLGLTATGKKKAERLVKAIVGVLNRHLDGFSPDELELFKSFLRRMLANREVAC